MDVKGIISVVAVTLAVFLAVWGLGGIVKKIPPETLKYINWFVSASAFISGLASYATGEAVYMYIFLASLVAYFLTISYKTES